MRRSFAALLVVTLVLLATASAIPASATHGGDTEVTVGSNDSIFSQNKQNEPAVAIDPSDPDVLAAGANDNIDMEACNAGDPTTCPFTAGVGGSGIYFSFDGGDTWTQPTYTGWSARSCLGPAECAPNPTGPIGTLPWYYENGLTSDGDPALAFGPRPDADGNFAWANGSRLYYASISSNFNGTRKGAFKGFEAVTVSRADDVVTAAAGGSDGKAAWKVPVVITSGPSATSFGDKEQIWVDDAASSSFFGNVYLCFAGFRSVGGGPAPLQVSRSTDAGDTWSAPVNLTNANDPLAFPTAGQSGCTVRTDSLGTLYVFWLGFSTRAKQNGEYLARSFDGGVTFERPRRLFTATTPGIIDPVIGRLTMDGIAGARDDLAPAPSVDIANGAPTGADATDEIFMNWVDGGTLDQEHALLSYSTDGGDTWSTPVQVEQTGDRPYYTALAISPAGDDLYLVYDAFLAPYQGTTGNTRPMVGTVRFADVDANGAVGTFGTIHVGASGDARGSSQNNLQAEFLGDYVYAAATNGFGVAVWNDVRNAADCPAMDAWRMFLRGGPEAPKPAPQNDCPATFGNTDIFGGSFADPTP